MCRGRKRPASGRKEAILRVSGSRVQSCHQPLRCSAGKRASSALRQKRSYRAAVEPLAADRFGDKDHSWALADMTPSDRDVCFFSESD